MTHNVQVIKLLQELGPLTSMDVARELGLTQSVASKVISRLKFEGHVHIANWTIDQEGQRKYARAQYALGNKKDMPRPKPDESENRRLYSYKINRMFRNNFVFHLGRPAMESRELAWKIGTRVME